MEFRVLGPIEVSDSAGNRIPLGSKRLRTLLAVLLMRAGRVVSVDELVDYLWGDGLHPDNPRAAIYTYVGRLRGLLGPGILLSKEPGYVIQLTPTDLQNFRNLVERAGSAAESADAARLLSQALVLWRGDPLADADSDLLRQVEIAGLVEERLRAVEQHIQARLELGEHGDLISQLAMLTAEYPHRERFWVQRMIALHRSGRDVDALDVYGQVSLYLSQELGLDPGPELQELRQTILEAKHRPVVRPAGQWVHRFQLPLDIRGFVGRDALRAELERTLRDRDARIVTIDGPPGVGKTALAIKVALRLTDSFPDGQWFLRLGGTSARSTGEVLSELLRLAGMGPAGQPEGLDARSAALREALADRSVLIVLDDAASVEQVRAVLPGLGSSVVLATSRQNLAGLAALEGAHRVALRALEPDESLALLAGLAGAAAVVDEPSAAGELTDLCGGLPLALRIAAANVAAQPDSTLADHVTDLRSGDRLAKLRIVGDPTAAVDRAFELSFSRLPEDAQQAFRLLGLVPGDDFGLPAVAALLGTDMATAGRLLDILAAANLVDRRTTDRFLLHDLLKLYAKRLAGQVRAASERLYDWYLRRSVEACHYNYRVHTGLPQPSVGPPQFDDVRQAEAWLAAERRNLIAMITAAEAVGLPDYAWRLTDVLRHYFLQSALHQDWRIAVNAGLQAASAAGDEVALGLMWQSLSNLDDSRGEFSQAVEHAQVALQLFRGAEDRKGEAAVLNNMAVSFLGQGQLERAEECLQASRQLFTAIGQYELSTLVLTNLSATLLSRGDLYGAIEAATEGLELDHRLNRPVGITAKLVNRADCYRLLGEHELALDDLTAAVAIANDSARGFHLTAAHVGLAAVFATIASSECARAHAETALGLARRMGDHWHQAISWRLLGDIELLDGLPIEADTAYRSSLEVAEERGLGQIRLEASLGLAAAFAQRGDKSAAIAAARQVLETACAAGMRVVETHAVQILARIDPTETRGEPIPGLAGAPGVRGTGRVIHCVPAPEIAK